MKFRVWVCLVCDEPKGVDWWRYFTNKDGIESLKPPYKPTRYCSKCKSKLVYGDGFIKGDIKLEVNNEMP